MGDVDCEVSRLVLGRRGNLGRVGGRRWREGEWGEKKLGENGE